MSLIPTPDQKEMEKLLPKLVDPRTAHCMPVTPTHYKLLSPMPPTEQSNASPKAPGAEISPSVV